MKSVAEEETLTSDEDSDEEKLEKVKTEEENKEKLEKDNKMVDILNDVPVKEVKENRSKMQIFNDAMNKAPGKGNNSDFSADSDEDDIKPTKKNKKEKKSKKNKKDKKESKDNKSQSKDLPNNASKSSIIPDVTNKRKVPSPQPPMSAKKIRIETPTATSFSIYSSSNNDSDGLNEESVRRYLFRKPMTTTELITKFRKLKNVQRDNLVETMTSILKKIKPIKQTIQGKMYLSLKEM